MDHLPWTTDQSLSQEALSLLWTHLTPILDTHQALSPGASFPGTFTSPLCLVSVFPHYMFWATVLASKKPSRTLLPHWSSASAPPLHPPALCSPLLGSPVLHCNFLSPPEADTAWGWAHRRCSGNIQGGTGPCVSAVLGWSLQLPHVPPSLAPGLLSCPRPQPTPPHVPCYLGQAAQSRVSQPLPCPDTDSPGR